MWLVYDWYFCKSIQIPQHLTCFLRFQIRHLRINNDAPTGQGFDSLKESFNTTAEQPAKGLYEKVRARRRLGEDEDIKNCSGSYMPI